MKKWFQNLTASYPFLKFLGNRYTLVLIFFMVWMLFLDNQSLWDQRSLNKQINELEDNKKYYKDENLYIGATRLKILDLDKRSDMPMIFNDLVISFNGEIYNFLEIKEKLMSIGEKFVTTSDTEVILRLFKNYKFENKLVVNERYTSDKQVI